jgi:hypothetical protein
MHKTLETAGHLLLIACFVGLIKLCVKLAWLEMGFKVWVWLCTGCGQCMHVGEIFSYTGGGLPGESDLCHTA